jgi:Putative MetA-pathway of phenol degradation
MQGHKATRGWLARLLELFRVCVCLAAAVVVIAPLTARAQAPREYLNTPINQWSGNIEMIFTRSQSAASAGLPLPNDLSVSRTTSPYLLYSFPWRKKYAGISVNTPFARIEAANGSLKASGFTDPAVAFHANLRGLPALKRSELAQYVPRTIVSVHFTVNLPVGKYDRNAPVNPGANRWAFTPLVNVNVPVHKARAWVELYASGRFFSDNNTYQGNKKLDQKPLLVLTGHFSHDIGKRFWASVGANYDNGGRTYVNGVGQSNYVNGFRPATSFSSVISRYRLTVRYENTKTTERASSRNGLLSIRVATLLF